MIRRTLVLALTLSVIAFAVAARAPTVLAHAAFDRSDPEPGAVLTEAPPRLSIWFTEPLARDLSSIEVRNAQAQQVDRGDSGVDPTDPKRMTIGLQPLANGTYTVAWRNVSTVDGHPQNGAFTFSVGEPGQGVQQATSGEPPVLPAPAEPFVRWAVLVAGLLAAGGLLFMPLVLAPALAAQRATRGDALPAARQRAERAIGYIVLVAMGAFFLAGGAQLAVQAAATYGLAPHEVSLEQMRSVIERTDWGVRWLWRMVLIVAAFLALGVLTELRRREAWRARVERFGPLVVLTPLAAALATVSLSSHSAATTGIEVAGALTDFAHLVAAALWGGGLVALLATLVTLRRGLDASAARSLVSTIARRFSVLALASVVVLVVTGLYSSWLHVTALRALSTPYGGALLMKLAAVAGLLALGAVNLLYLRPRLARRDATRRWLRRTVAAEVTLIVGVLLAVGFMTSLEPARQVETREAAKRGLSFEATAEGTRISGRLEPGTAGVNRLVITLRDRRGDAVHDATAVQVRQRFVAADLGEKSVSATHEGEGAYIADGLLLSVAGAWELEVFVARPGAFDATATARYVIRDAAQQAAGAELQPSPERGRELASWLVVALGVAVLAATLAARSRPARARITILGVALALSGGVLVYGARTPAEGTSGGVENPIAPSAESIAAGRELFTSRCVECHGALGFGDGPRASSLNPPPADLVLHVPFHSDGQLFTFVARGLPGTAMPAFAGSLTDEQIWHLVNYLRTLAAPPADR